MEQDATDEYKFAYMCICRDDLEDLKQNIDGHYIPTYCYWYEDIDPIEFRGTFDLDGKSFTRISDKCAAHIIECIIKSNERARKIIIGLMPNKWEDEIYGYDAFLEMREDLKNMTVEEYQEKIKNTTIDEYEEKQAERELLCNILHSYVCILSQSYGPLSMWICKKCGKEIHIDEDCEYGRDWTNRHIFFEPNK